jgi:DNA primase
MNAKTHSTRRVDWKNERTRIDLADVATNLLGPPPGRRGRGLWWRCPFHDDAHPSFQVDPVKGRWRCFGCGVWGDAANLVARLRHCSFPEALDILLDRVGGGRASSDAPAHTSRSPGHSAPATQRARDPHLNLSRSTSGLDEDEARHLVEEAVSRLWSPEGADALRYLTGPERGLSAATIRGAGLGWTPETVIPKAGGGVFGARGIVIPWRSGNTLALVKLRQPNGRTPKYVEAFRDPARVSCYPGLLTIRKGRPTVIVEGEFDTLALGEALGDAASVLTLGSASMRPTSQVVWRLKLATSTFLATDADPAGDRAAASWQGYANRVRPPDGFKDWSAAYAAGVDLALHWREHLP